MAQFSPGELSQAHATLEGMTNCVRCHEVGAEISGAKCLECHKEIREAIASKHGYHAATAGQRCVDCHKEHLGRNARTLVVGRDSFDHAKTGFFLAGKHSTLRCDDCHRPEFVRNQDILNMMMERGKTSVLGLDAACVSCHQDRHRGTLGTDCRTCHTEDTWSPARGFDHAKTSFPLRDKHGTVACVKCHPSESGKEDRVFDLPPIRFADCTPCHVSPHRQKLAESCSACHATAGWTIITTAAFSHDATGFPLRGKHSTVACAKCHGEGTQKKTAARPIRICSDCHADYHHQEFLAKYANDCSRCHSVYGFTPSSFTLEMHDSTNFRLTGAHVATICNSCHRPGESQRATFRFTALSCTTCHSDPHAGQFDRGKGTICSDCHTTTTWNLPDFDHAATGFALQGKHAGVPCGKCHRAEPRDGKMVARYVDVPSRCESCHTDPHAGQFVTGRNTTCSACHSTEGWTHLVFRHDTQSSFALAGAHARVPCRSCHPTEDLAGVTVVRFKPLETKCEGCHAGKVPDER